MATKNTTPVGIGDELMTTAAHGVTVRSSGVYDFTEGKFQSDINASVGALSLPWMTDLATTRSQVIQAHRKRNLIISYTTPEGDNVTEKYIGSEDSFSTGWASSKNWYRLANADSENIQYSEEIEYSEGSMGRAITDLKKEVIKNEKVAASVMYDLDETLNSHLANKNNPHETTKAQVGLGNADNTSDFNKPVSVSQQSALNKKADRTDIKQVWNTLNGSEFKDLKEVEIWGDQGCTYRPVDTKEGNYPDIVYALFGIGISSTKTYESGSFAVTVSGGNTTLKYCPTGETGKYYSSSITGTITKDRVVALNKNTALTGGSIIGKPVSFGNIVTPEGGLLKNVSDHHTNISNPHNVTKSQVGLGNVDNTSDVNKPVSTAQKQALDKKVDKSSLGVANGVATLDGAGKVPHSQLPTYLADDIAEYPNRASFPTTGETGKAYIALDTSKIYRWSTVSNSYVETSAFAHNELDSKVDKIPGKGLSTEDLTTERKDHLETLWKNLGGEVFIDDTDDEVDIQIYNQTETDYLLSLKASKSELNEYMSKFDEMYFMYGVEWDTSNSNPDVTRIGNMNFHKTLPIHKDIRGCKLGNDGRVIEYLPKSSWGNIEGLDGTGDNGMVMVEIPKFFWKFESEGTIRRVKLSTIPLEGYTEVPKVYVSAYEATLNRESKMLASVKNPISSLFRGGNNNSDYDYTYRSLLGRPVSGESLSDLRRYARNRGDHWNTMTYQVQKELYWLFVVEYATLNSQKPINSTLTSEGYHQGGLGEGASQVETYATWNSFNGANPVIPCGFTDYLGGGTGEKTYTATGAGGSTVMTLKANRYRGIENPFGHLWCWVDGIHALVPGGAADVSQIYTAPRNPEFWGDLDNTGYSFAGNISRESGWIKDVTFGEQGEITCTTVGGGNTINHCDYYTTQLPSTTTGALYGVIFGGCICEGLSAGLVGQGISTEPGSTHLNYIGTRLTYMP